MTVITAWQVEKIRILTANAQGTLPALADLLKLPGRRQSVAEQRRTIEMLSEQYGIPIRERRPA